MKKALIIFVFAIFIFSCENDKENKYPGKSLELLSVTPGGCAGNDTYALKILPIYYGTDTIIITSVNDSLNIFVGFNRTCCSEFTTSASINIDTINIEIQTSVDGMCDCICYYTYSFNFKQFSQSYFYKVFIDDRFFFEGKIDKD